MLMRGGPGGGIKWQDSIPDNARRPTGGWVIGWLGVEPVSVRHVLLLGARFKKS